METLRITIGIAIAIAVTGICAWQFYQLFKTAFTDTDECYEEDEEMTD